MRPVFTPRFRTHALPSPFRPLALGAIVAAAVALLALPATRASTAPLGTSATSSVGDFDTDIPVDDMVVEHPCTHEMVVLSGRFHFHSHTSPSGDVSIHIETHEVGASTLVLFPGEQPRKYVDNETQNDTTHFAPGGAASQHTVWNWTFIRTGEDDGLLCCGDDWHLHLNLKLDLVGGVTVPTLEDLDGDCN